MSRKRGGRLYLSDTPIESVDEDEFRHKEYVDTIEKIVEDVEPPWNIGVFGEWGSGKTSIIKMLYSRLREGDGDYICVEFDAWKHAEESIRADLLLNIDQAIGKEIDQKLDGSPAALGEEAITEELYDVSEETKRTGDERDTQDILKHFIEDQKYVAGSIVAIGIIALLTGVFVSPSHGTGVFTIMVIPLLLHMTRQLSNATDTLQKKFLYPRKEWSGAYEQLFDEILSKTEAEKVIISIDNLDRCESETVYDVLVSLKTFLEKEECVYLIPCDDQALQSHIESIDEHGDYFDNNGQEFLRKFFQTHIRIPKFIEEDVEEYAEIKNEELARPFKIDVLDIVTQAYVNNPRRIKQSLNQLTTLRVLAEQMEEEKHINQGKLTDNMEFLAKMMIIEEEYPQFYSELQEDPRLLGDVNEFLRGDLDDENRKERVNQILSKASRSEYIGSQMKNFLERTIQCTVDNPEPFLQIGEPSFTSKLDDSEEFAQSLWSGESEEIKDRLHTVQEEKSSFDPYIQVIESRLVTYSDEQRKTRLFNVIDVVTLVLDEFDEESQERVAEVVAPYLELETVVDFFADFEADAFFQLVLEIPDKELRESILVDFAKTVASKDKLNEEALTEFVENAEGIPDKASEQLSNSILSLGQGEIESALDTLSRTEASKSLASSDLLKYAASQIRWDDDSNRFDKTDQYTSLDSQAKPSDRSYYVEELIDLEEDVHNDDMNRYRRRIREELDNLDGEVSFNTGSRLFDKIQDWISDQGQDVNMVRVAIEFHSSYDAETKEDFKRWIAEQIITWDENKVQSILNNLEDNDIDIEYDEDTVDRILDRIDDDITNDDIILDSLVPAIPSEYDENLHRMVQELCENNDHNQNTLAAKILAQYPDRMGEERDTVLDQCRRQLNRANNTTQKGNYLEAEAAVYAQLDETEKEKFVNSRLDSLLEGDRSDYDLFNTIWKDLEEEVETDRRVTVARNITDTLINEIGDNQVGQQLPLVKALRPLMQTEDVDEDDGERIVERLSSNFEDNNVNRNQVTNLIQNLAEFRNYYGKEEQVLTRIESLLENNSNSRIHQATEDLINSLDEAGEVSEERPEEVREKL
jgi:hypothetical protein